MGADTYLVPLYKDEAVVLRTHKLGEADRIVTLLSRYNGQIRAVAKGVRRTGSKFGARLEPFMVVDAQFYEGRNLDVVNQVETIGSYGREIIEDYRSYTAATAMGPMNSITTLLPRSMRSIAAARPGSGESLAGRHQPLARKQRRSATS